QISPLLAQLIMFLAPVCYPPTAVPDAFRNVIHWNPITWFVDGYRAVLLESRMPAGLEVMEQTLLWGAFAYLGWLFFQRTRRMFGDLLCRAKHRNGRRLRLRCTIRSSLPCWVAGLTPIP